MKTETLVLRHWEDVVFENRNQSYGAYRLRRAYSKRVIVGWGITVALVAALLYLPPLLESNASNIIEAYDGGRGKVDLIPLPPLPPKPKPKPMPPASTPKAKTPGPIVVTTDPVETEVASLEPVNGTPDGIENGTEIEGLIEGNAGEPVIENLPYTPPPVVDIAEVMPKYSGGTEAMMKFIQKKIRVPSSFKFLQEGGTVYVRFIIRPDGKVTDVEVIRGISKDCDKEAARVISIMPQWIAGMQNGTPVSVRMVLPIRFAKEN
jgi:periplasmic protein TonB